MGKNTNIEAKAAKAGTKKTGNKRAGVAKVNCIPVDGEALREVMKSKKVSQVLIDMETGKMCGNLSQCITRGAISKHIADVLETHGIEYKEYEPKEEKAAATAGKKQDARPAAHQKAAAKSTGKEKAESKKEEKKSCACLCGSASIGTVLKELGYFANGAEIEIGGIKASIKVLQRELLNIYTYIEGVQTFAVNLCGALAAYNAEDSGDQKDKSGERRPGK